MKKLLLEIELEYDDQAMHGDEPDSIAWFWERVLLYPEVGCGLELHSNEIGDEVGPVKIVHTLESRVFELEEVLNGLVHANLDDVDDYPKIGEWTKRAIAILPDYKN